MTDTLTRVKYPRTPHLPSSPGATDDDKRMSTQTAKNLFREQVVMTEKMDGGNVTLARDYFHARSTSDLTPRWEQHAKSEWAKVAHEIPEGWRVSAESLWAQRSVPYDNLPAYLMVIGIWDDWNNLLTWSQTEEWAALLGLPTVPVLGQGWTDERTALSIWVDKRDPETSEGFVVRSIHNIPYDKFGERVGKWVRPDHVRTAASWRHSNNFPTNGLA
ncbi:hypothetical protein FHT44_005148 [Mycolicibacterium sp. BK634]|uniref:RNA ligase family protein n=1 Tax=Mycolicibacterium sp. BK634 TaxID=2587099 RepID=UPI0016078D83|nr:RNA ligase family protein [Mycolicibacterium sp. BK634]MBB3752636.1 hypothetical protein [Mycolicibacterium sp. BK634]